MCRTALFRDALIVSAVVTEHGVKSFILESDVPLQHCSQ